MHKSTKINQQSLDWVLSQPLDKQLMVMSNHLEICQRVIHSLMQSHMNELVGKKHSYHKTDAQSQYCRWGYNPGSVRIGNQRLDVQVPRVFDTLDDKKFNLPFYNLIKDLPEQKEEMVLSVLKGLSMRDYSSVSKQLTDSFGLSRSSISNHFIEYATEEIKEFFERDLSKDRYVAIFIDGKYLQREQMMVVLGVTEHGIKKVLHVIQTHSENSEPIADMLENLKERGLYFQDGLLIVIDGSKGLRKAAEKSFGEFGIIQRCRWHKRENVLKYLKESDGEVYKKKIQDAYEEPKYENAKAQLETIIQDLEKLNISAANSLREGIEETLTLHKLNLPNVLRKSLATTNCIESLNSQISKYCKNVKRWMNSKQRHRWTILGCLEAEKSFQRIAGNKSLHLLQEALKKEVEIRKSAQTILDIHDKRVSTKI